MGIFPWAESQDLCEVWGIVGNPKGDPTPLRLTFAIGTEVTAYAALRTEVVVRRRLARPRLAGRRQRAGVPATASFQAVKTPF